MLDQTAADLVIRLAAVYALVGLFAALTLIAVFALVRAIRVPRLLRTAFYAVYVIVAAGLVAAYAAGALQAPNVAAQQVVVAAESAKAFEARSRSIVPGDPATATQATLIGTVYIQVPDMDARFAAVDLSSDLRSAGFRSPGIEVVSGRSPSSPEVRYFNDADRPLADQVAAIAAKHGLQGSVVKTIANYTAPPGQMEFWYPR